MENKVSVSVLMPVYNEVYTVLECLKRIRRVSSDYISEMEIIVVDDGSTDGTRDILREFVVEQTGIFLVEHETNQGKGRAVRTALSRASKDICIIQDADLEYNPEDYEKMVIPFIKENADAVFGSRFLTGNYSRVLYFRHAIVNHILTFMAGWISDINYTDIETCYKAVKARLLKSIPIRGKRFSIEPELAIKLAKRKAIIYEVPISYAGRTKEAGKKIGWVDGVVAFFTLIKYWLIDDIFLEDKNRSKILNNLAHAPGFSKWQVDKIRPCVGADVLEIGAGVGNITTCLLPRRRYVVSDIDKDYFDYLENLCLHKPYMDVVSIDLAREKDFAPYRDQFDTVICFNVLEHVKDDLTGLKNIYTSLKPGGRAIILVPYGRWLFSSLDKALDHRRRYSDAQLIELARTAGYSIEKMITSFNRIGVLAWILNGKILRREYIPLFHVKMLNTFLGIFRLVNAVIPWHGLSTIAVLQKPGED